MTTKSRKTINKFGFLASVIGATVGLGGIWGFPTQVYAHKGAFFIPFIISMIICAIPVLFLEMTIGNKSRKNHVEFFTNVAGKKGALIAWLNSSTVLILSTYYSVLIGWCLINIIIGFTSSLNQQNFFFEEILKQDNALPPVDPRSFSGLGSMNWKVLVATAVIWIILIVILLGGVDKGIDKANKVFIPALFVMIIILVIYTSTLNGAGTGLNEMLKFEPKKMLDPGLWKSAFSQAFFMLSTCTGTIYIYSAHAPKNQDNTNHAFVVGLGTSIVGILTAIIIFNSIGNIAASRNNGNGVPFDEVFKGGPALIFQVLPELFININKSVPFLGNIISIMFFLTLFFAGMSSLIGMIESTVNGLEYEAKVPRITALLMTSLFAMLLSVIFTFNNSLALFNPVGNWVSGTWLLILGLTLLIGIGPIGWNVYPELKEYNNKTSWFKWNKFYGFIMLVLAPALLFINIIAAFYDTGVGIVSNPFTNGFFGLILGFVVPLVLSIGLVFHKEISLLFTKKRK